MFEAANSMANIQKKRRKDKPERLSELAAALTELT
jgi:hypothetical protein